MAHRGPPKGTISTVGDPSPVGPLVCRQCQAGMLAQSSGLRSSASGLVCRCICHDNDQQQLRCQQLAEEVWWRFIQSDCLGSSQAAWFVWLLGLLLYNAF